MVVVIPPGVEHEAAVRQRREQRLVEAFVAQALVLADFPYLPGSYNTVVVDGAKLSAFCVIGLINKGFAGTEVSIAAHVWHLSRTS